MLYAQFYQRSATNPANIIEACGDRAVIILDGRQNPTVHETWITEQADARGYVAWQLFRGATFTRSNPVGHIHMVP